VSYRIIVGDCIDGLRTMPDASVQTCITSPPYYGLRDYGNDGQIGLEDTPEAYIAKMVEVFREVKRVLRDDGTVWLNIGDSYAGSGKGRNADGTHAEGGKQATNKGTVVGSLTKTHAPACKPKDLIGIPWMLAFALRADGWYLRQDIIWHKPNPMPESVVDRCTKAHEYLFLLSKSGSYYFDHEAVKEPLAASSIPRLKQNIEAQVGTTRANGGAKTNGNFKAVGDTENGTRNRRSVWSITTRPFKSAHFAVMPEALVEPCILAGTPIAGCCANCGAPRERVIFATAPDGRRAEVKGGKAYDENGKPLMGDNMIDHGVRGSFGSKGGQTLKRETVSFRASCECDAETVPSLVLDPFTGSGTVAVVALRHDRAFVGCELNPDYVKIAETRIFDQAPLFAIR
jgi:DNA modification methylase